MKIMVAEAAAVVDDQQLKVKVETMSASKQFTFATTVDYLRDPRFAARARLIKRPPPGKLGDAISIFVRVLRAAFKEKVLLLTSSWGKLHPDLLATAVIGLWPQRFRPIILFMGCMWEPNDGIRAPLERLVVKLADRAVHRYVVQSSEEMSVFPDTWNVAQSKVDFCPFFFSFTKDDLEGAILSPGEGHVFAGGNSHRNYEPLVEAARQMPERRFIFATHLLEGRSDLPPNLTAKPVSHFEFVALMRSAAATVVPIKRGLHRAVGQQTYLNAMWLGKPTVVTDTLGVRDYIVDGENALIVDGSPESYTETLRWIFDPGNQREVDRLRTNACQTTQAQFSFEKHITRLLAILDESV
jgi:glycosyltransferase involved in cell wall biosynthesis